MALVKVVTLSLNGETTEASSIVDSKVWSTLVENLTIPIFKLSLSFKRLETKLLAELKIRSFLVLPSETSSVILSELSNTNMSSPVGLSAISSLVTCNCKVTSLLAKSLLINFFSNLECCPNGIVQIGSSTTLMVTVL